MTDKQWFRLFLAHLRRDDDESFRHTAAWHLAAIRAAARAGDVSARQSAAAVYGAFLKADRGAMRAKMALAIIDELGITATQHVGSHILKSTFGESMDCALLDFYFSLPGRDATVKHMKDAKRRLASRPDCPLRYRALYAWYRKAQDRAVYQVKYGTRRPLRRFDKAPHIQPAQHPAPLPAPRLQLSLFG